MASKSLGTLTLDLVAKTSGFVSGMDKAERESAKFRRKVKKNMDQVNAALGRVAKIGAAGAVAAFGAVAAASIKQANAIAQLEARLKSTDGVAGKTSQELQVLAGALQKTTTFGDEAIIELEALLLTFTNIRGEIYDAALPAVLDMSVAMGTDLKSSALQLGKALNDPILGITALSRAGIQFTDDQKDVIKSLVETGRTADAQKLILEELTKQFGGAAEAAANTFGGALIQVKNALGDLLENPAGLEANTAALKELTEYLQDPETVAAAQVLTSALINGFRDVSEAIHTTVGLTQFLAEELAVIRAGAAFDDIVRLEEQLEKTRSAIENPTERLRFFGPGGVIEYWDEDELNTEVARLEKAIAIRRKEMALEYKSRPIPILGGGGDGGAAPLNLPPALSDEQKRLAKSVAATIASLELQAKTIGKTKDEALLLELALKGAGPEQLKLADAALKTVTAYDAGIKTQEEYKSLVDDLRTDEEKLTDQLNERLAVLEKISNITDEERNRARNRIAAAAIDTEGPSFSGLSPEVGGAGSELAKINEAQAELEEWYSTQLDLLAKFREEKAGLSAQWDEQEASLHSEHADRLIQIDHARQQAALVAAEDLFGNLAGLTRQFAGENSAAYKVLFAAEKSAAIARSIVAIQTALAQASASAPFPANLAAMATVAANTASIIATISAVTLQGQAHDGLMSVPKTGTYLLERGERVTTANTSAKLDKTLDGMSGGGGKNIRIINSFDSSQVVGDYMGSGDGEQVVMNIVRRNARTIRSLTA